MKTLLYIMISSMSTLQACRPQLSESQVKDQPAVTALQKASRSLQTEQDLDALLAAIGNSRYVLLGEASHGTSEFYQWRAAITRRLIQEKGFTLVTVEGDWPDAYALNQFVQGKSSAKRGADVVQAFDRWPTWMWANTEIAQLADWMRAYNAQNTRKASFYGLDVYSLWESLEQLTILKPTDPQTAALANQALQCFDGYKGDEQAYATATLKGTRCNDALNQLLSHVQNRYATDSDTARFNVLQNAQVAVNAEEYYYAMVRDDAESWNVRDRHMASTLDRLMQLHGPDSKVIVWAHNTHVGDARFTDMAKYGMVNLGQLVRESHQAEGVYIVGFGTYQGDVIAGSYWEAPHERMNVPTAQNGSWDELLHRVSPDNKIVFVSELRNEPVLTQSRGQRAIGVVYNPARESGNYVPTRLTERYDGLLFIDRTQALTPQPKLPLIGKQRSGAPVGAYALIND
ncbi:MAG: protein-L-isoaspartate O-methyltransferase [Spirosoma sp.]|nr:protein-L-isoaspartate O-methyltransferase [Spirosoma sp.]